MADKYWPEPTPTGFGKVRIVRFPGYVLFVHGTSVECYYDNPNEGGYISTATWHVRHVGSALSFDEDVNKFDRYSKDPLSLRAHVRWVAKQLDPDYPGGKDAVDG